MQRKRFRVQLANAHMRLRNKTGKKLCRAVTRKLYLTEEAMKYVNEKEEELKKQVTKNIERRQTTYRMNVAAGRETK